MSKRQQRFTFDRRASGLLLHPTSLPGPHGSGDLGPAAHAFAEFLAAAGQRWWQMLPVGPPGEGHSPYSAASAFAGHPALISPDVLVERGLLGRTDVKPPRWPDPTRVDHNHTLAFRLPLLRVAFERFRARGGERQAGFRRFVEDNAFWLDDYVLFAALKKAMGEKPWSQWDAK